MDITHAPKGGMCVTCANIDSGECHNLPFDTMRVIEVHDGVKFVKCTEYKRESVE